MAGLINLRLLTDFFNKIGQKATFVAITTPAKHPSGPQPTYLLPQAIGNRAVRRHAVGDSIGQNNLCKI